MSVTKSLVAAVSLMALAGIASAQQPPSVAPPAAPAAADTKVITVDAVHALVLPMKGSYAQHPEAFARLTSFLSGRGVAPAGVLFARYFSDPSVGEAELVWEVGISVPASLKAEAPFEIKDLPATQTAMRVHHGALEELGTAWPAFIQWIISNGYQPAGPATQVFRGFETGAPEVELRMPVQK